MQLTGTIKEIKQTQEISSTYKKRELALTTDEQYPQTILVEFSQDKCDILNNYSVGESVQIDINLRGREWTNPEGEVKYFNTIQGWRINKLNSNTQKENSVPQTNFVIEDDAPF